MQQVTDEIAYSTSLSLASLLFAALSLFIFFLLLLLLLLIFCRCHQARHSSSLYHTALARTVSSVPLQSLKQVLHKQFGANFSYGDCSNHTVETMFQSASPQPNSRLLSSSTETSNATTTNLNSSPAQLAWAQRRDAFRQSCDRQTRQARLFDTEWIREAQQPPLINSNLGTFSRTSSPSTLNYSSLNPKSQFLQRPTLAHQASSSSCSSSPADLQSAAEKGRVGKHRMPLQEHQLATIEPNIRSNSRKSSSVPDSSSSSDYGNSSCSECCDSDEQLERPFLRTRSSERSFSAASESVTRSPIIATPSTVTASSSIESAESSDLQAKRVQCRSLLSLLDSPRLPRAISAPGARPTLRRSHATGGSIESSSDGEFESRLTNKEHFYPPKIGKSSSDLLSSRGSQQSITCIAKTQPTRVMGRRQTALSIAQIRNANQSTKRFVQRLPLKIALNRSSPSFEVEPEIDQAYLPLNSFDRSLDSAPDVSNINDPACSLERSHTVGSNLRSLTKPADRLAECIELKTSLDRCSTFDSLRSLETRVAEQPPSKPSVGLQCIRSLNPIRAFKPMRGLNPLRTLAGMKPLGRLRSLSAAELREEQPLNEDRIPRLSCTPQPSNIESYTCDLQLTPENGEQKPWVDITLAFDQTARKLLLCVRSAYSLWLSGEQQLQVKLVLLPSGRRKCKTKFAPCINGQALFGAQFTWNRISPEQIPHCGIRCTLESISSSTSGATRRCVLGEHVIPFTEIRPQQQARRITLPMNAILQPTPSESNSDATALQTRGELRCRTSRALAPTAKLTRALQLQLTNTQQQIMNSVSRAELLLGLSYNATTGRLQVSVLRGSQLHELCAQKPPHSYVKCALISCTGQELARGKTSVRRAQPNPVFKHSFAFQVTLFQLPDVNLVVSVYNRKSMNRKELIGSFSLGCNSSGEEENAHWNEMRDSKGEQICRWHVLSEQRL